MDGWGIQDNVYEGVGDGQQEVGLKMILNWYYLDCVSMFRGASLLRLLPWPPDDV